MQLVDVYLTSKKHGLEFGISHVIPAWVLQRTEHEIELTEVGGWVDMHTDKPPSKPDFKRLLQSLSSIRIR